jgi:hypothetical protein
MRRFGIAVGCLAIVLCAVQVGVVLADTITLNAVHDCTIREKNDSGWQDAGIGGDSVWANDAAGGDGGLRRTVIQFDLSGVSEAITSAKLVLHQYPSTGSGGVDQNAYQHESYLVTPADISGLTKWSLKDSWTWQKLDSLGNISLPANSPSAWYDSSLGSTADVALLEGIRAGSVKQVSIGLVCPTGSGARDWDAVGCADSPQLVLNAIPEPSVVAMTLTGIFGLLAYAWRRRK